MAQEQSMPDQPSREASDTRRWLGDTPVLNLRDDKLRLRVQTVTQFSRTETEKVRAICHYVASIPFDVPPFRRMRHTRVTLSQRHAVGWYSKAALFQAMLRAAGIPARTRMIRVGPDMFRGLADTRLEFVLPVTEVWTGGRWVVTDSYVYDAPYLAAAREAVTRRGWRSGYGVHLDGLSRWDGIADALVMIVPDRTRGPVPPEYLGVYDDPQELDRELRAGSFLRWVRMRIKNRIMSIRMHRRVRQLRRDAGS
jgi:hypothetical protein